MALYCHLPKGAEENHDRTAGLCGEIWTKNLPNAKQGYWPLCDIRWKLYARAGEPFLKVHAQIVNNFQRNHMSMGILSNKMSSWSLASSLLIITLYIIVVMVKIRTGRETTK
jgi:hypothetical protein